MTAISTITSAISGGMLVVSALAGAGATWAAMKLQLDELRRRVDQHEDVLKAKADKSEINGIGQRLHDLELALHTKAEKDDLAEIKAELRSGLTEVSRRLDSFLKILAARE